MILLCYKSFRCKRVVRKYLSNAEKIVSKPTLVHLFLAEALLADEESYGKRYKKSDKQKQQAWDKVIQMIIILDRCIKMSILSSFIMSIQK
ncbi:hypothetical protein ACP8HZ_02675 [Francisella noatunensis]